MKSVARGECPERNLSSTRALSYPTAALGASLILSIIHSTKQHVFLAYPSATARRAPTVSAAN